MAKNTNPGNFANDREKASRAGKASKRGSSKKRAKTT